jgi:transposase-like protein
MAKYSKKIVNRICKLISSDTYTIAEICLTVGISERSFYTWKEEKSEFAEAIARAQDQFDEILVKEAKNSLRKKINGYTVDETKTLYVDSKEVDPVTRKPKAKIKEQTIIKKHFQPDTAAIVFALTNKASGEYQNRVNNEVTGKGGKDLFGKYSGMTDEELDQKIEETLRKLNG